MLAIGHAHSAPEAAAAAAAMKYMSDPFPARRDQHAFQIASRTFFLGCRCRRQPLLLSRGLAVGTDSRHLAALQFEYILP